MSWYIISSLYRSGVLLLNGRRVSFETKQAADEFIESMSDEKIKASCQSYWLKRDTNSINATGMTEHELLVSEGVI